MEKTTLVPVTSKLCLMDALINREGVYPLSTNTVAFNPVDNLTTFIPLVVQERETEILVSIQDNTSENKLSVFTEDLANKADYHFSKDTLLNILEEDADLLFEITAILERCESNEFVTEDKLMLILTTLKDANIGIARALLILSAASREELTKLFIIADELPTNISDYFLRVLSSRYTSNDAEYDIVCEDAIRRYDRSASLSNQDW